MIRHSIIPVTLLLALGSVQADRWRAEIGSGYGTIAPEAGRRLQEDAAVDEYFGVVQPGAMGKPWKSEGPMTMVGFDLMTQELSFAARYEETKTRFSAGRNMMTPSSAAVGNSSLDSVAEKHTSTFLGMPMFFFRDSLWVTPRFGYRSYGLSGRGTESYLSSTTNTLTGLPEGSTQRLATGTKTEQHATGTGWGLSLEYDLGGGWRIVAEADWFSGMRGRFETKGIAFQRDVNFASASALSAVQIENSTSKVNVQAQRFMIGGEVEISAIAYLRVAYVGHRLLIRHSAPASFSLGAGTLNIGVNSFRGFVGDFGQELITDTIMYARTRRSRQDMVSFAIGVSTGEGSISKPFQVGGLQ